MLRRTLAGLGTLALASALVASTTMLDGRTETVSRGAATIALVNEDRTASFNGVDFLFGLDFVHLVSTDTRYNWQIVSRNVAENAYVDKSVSAVVYLPQSFSHDILTLQDLDPVKANIDYKVRVDGTELSNQVLQNRISTILHDFNTRIVKMYFASIAGNISEAQVNMASVVGSESALVDALAQGLSPELNAANQGYGTSVSLAGILQALNAEWISAQNRFTENTTSTLAATSRALDAHQPSLSDYFAEQAEIAETNAANANGAIASQNESDKDHYDKAFSDFSAQLRSGTGGWAGFDGLLSADDAGNTSGVLAALTEAVAGYNAQATEFNARVASTNERLHAQVEALAASMRDLEALETRLLAQYFDVAMPEHNAAIGIPPADIGIDDSNYAIDPTTLTADMARTALAQKVARSFGNDASVSATVAQYERTIRALLTRLPTDPAQYDRLFAALQANTSFDPAPYAAQLGLIRSYDAAYGIVAPALNVVPRSAGATDQTIDKTLPVTVPPGKSYRVVATLPSALGNADVTARAGAPALGCPTGTPSCVAVDPVSASVMIDNSAGTVPLTVGVTFVIHLRDLTGTVAIGYSARDALSPAAEPLDLGREVYTLLPANAAREGIGGEDFAAITSVLSDIQTAANMLLFLYGAPGDTPDAFARSVATDGDFTGRSTESVFNRYGTIDARTLARRLDAADVAGFQALGRENIQAVIDQIRDLQAAISATNDSIASLSRLQLSDTYFSTVIDQLYAWYARAMACVSAAPAEWSANTNAAIQLPVLPWRERHEGGAELYLDDDTGPALYRTLSELIAATSQDASATAASAQIITDNSAEFDALVAGVNTTRTSSEAVLDAMNGIITTGTTELSASGAYSERFATVLSNTRADGVDPDTIYDAFANPVTTNDTSPAAPTSADGAFDIRWVILFIAGSLIGGLVVSVVTWRRGRPRDTH